MKKRIIFTVAASSVFILSSCSTILRGTSQNIMIASNPSGAVVKVNDIEKGITPVKIDLKKGSKQQIITVEKIGYKKIEIEPKTKFSTIAILNTLGMVGWIVDIATGALREFESEAYDVDLIKQ